MKDAELERAFEELPRGNGPPDGWQDKVRARIEVAPVHRASWPVALAGTTLLAAAMVFALFYFLRTPAQKAAAPERPASRERAEALFERLEGAVHGLVQTKDRAYQQLSSARTEAERALAEKALEDARKELERVERLLQHKRVRLPKLDDGKISVKCDPNDPLCAVE